MNRKDDNLMFQEQVLQMGYPMVSNAVIYYPGLSLGAKVAYTILCAHAYGKKNTSFPSMDRIAYLMGKTRTSVIRYIKELQDIGLVEITPGTRQRGENNTYILKKIPQELVDTFLKVSGKTKPIPK